MMLHMTSALNHNTSDFSQDLEQLHEIRTECFRFAQFKTLRSGHLAAGQLAEVRLEVLSDHCINGHQAEHTGFPHTALRVVVTLLSQIKTGG